MSAAVWPTWEVFVRPNRGVNHIHVGSVQASDAELAIESGRDLFTRRSEGVSLWVLRSDDIHRSDPDDREELFDPAADKTFRFPTDYEIPGEVGHM